MLPCGVSGWASWRFCFACVESSQSLLCWLRKRIHRNEVWLALLVLCPIITEATLCPASRFSQGFGDLSPHRQDRVTGAWSNDVCPFVQEHTRLGMLAITYFSVEQEYHRLWPRHSVEASCGGGAMNPSVPICSGPQISGHFSWAVSHARQHRCLCKRQAARAECSRLPLRGQR